MRITREQYEADLATLVARVELSGLKMDMGEVMKKVEEISKRSLDDGDLFSKTLVSHAQRLRLLEQRANRRK
ncbi:MAG TPA: hypothetical protein VHQ41_02355 [Patescibacteria group bacterium]|jgi:hypothetical protein|nr:hypothetical protein [Patescibacteria group bacterium]